MNINVTVAEENDERVRPPAHEHPTSLGMLAEPSQVDSIITTISGINTDGHHEHEPNDK
jgi:hypothetical protein